jgi:ribosomal protein S18 acetylase RimI-like enzyme
MDTPHCTIRPMLASDIPATMQMRGQTRENAVTREEMARDYGITPEGVAADMERGLFGWVVEDRGQIKGFAMGDARNGEVVVIALLPECEGRGLGRALLTLVTDRLLSAGHDRLWLNANPDPAVRASGFYLRLGWRPSGEWHGEDIVLEWRPGGG